MYVFLSRLNLLVLLAIWFAVGCGQQADESAENPIVSDEELEAVVDSFHEALVSADSMAVAALMVDDARVLEGGNIETKEEYLSHHFHADANFLSTVERTIEDRTVFSGPQTAWVTTKSRLKRTTADQALDISSVELMILTNQAGAWRMSAVHWSSGR